MGSMRSLHSQRGYTLIEVVVAIVILSIFALGTIAFVPFVRYMSVATGLRSSAVMALESSIEVLRNVGFEDLDGKLLWNGVPANGIDNVWEYDPVEGGELASSIVLRRGFQHQPGQGGEDWVEDPERAVMATQTCSIVTAGTELGKSEKFLRVTLTVQWPLRGRENQEVLYTIIEY